MNVYCPKFIYAKGRKTVCPRCNGYGFRAETAFGDEYRPAGQVQTPTPNERLNHDPGAGLFDDPADDLNSHLDDGA